MGEQVLVDVDHLKLTLLRLQQVLRSDEERVRSDGMGYGGIARRLHDVDPVQGEPVSVTAVRALATAAGIDPFTVTDRFAGVHYPHAFDDDGGRGYWDVFGSRGCRKCIFHESWHDPDGNWPPHSSLAPPPPDPEQPSRFVEGVFAIKPSANTPGIPVLGGGFVEPTAAPTTETEQ